MRGDWSGISTDCGLVVVEDRNHTARLAANLHDRESVNNGYRTVGVEDRTGRIPPMILMPTVDDPIPGRCQAGCVQLHGRYSCARCHWHTRTAEDLEAHIRGTHGPLPFPLMQTERQ